MKTAKYAAFFSALGFLLVIIVLLSSCAKNQEHISRTNDSDGLNLILDHDPIDYTEEEIKEEVADEIFYYDQLLKMWDDEYKDNSPS